MNVHESPERPGRADAPESGAGLAADVAAGASASFARG